MKAWIVSGLLASVVSMGCSAATEDRPAGEETAEEALTAKNAGATALLSATETATAKRLHCRTGAGVAPKFELDVFTPIGGGNATVLIRRYAKSTFSEWTTPGTFDGIPRAGDLQGTVSFKLGGEDVAFDYMAEKVDDACELTFNGTTIPMLCTM